MRGFVLDTSVILKWFSEAGESDLDRALQLRQSMLGRTVFFVVPDLLFYELANALRREPCAIFQNRPNEREYHKFWSTPLPQVASERTSRKTTIKIPSPRLPRFIT